MLRLAESLLFMLMTGERTSSILNWHGALDEYLQETQ